MILYQDSLSPYGQCVGAIMYEHPSLSLRLIQVYSSFWTKITSGSVITYAGLGHLYLEITFLPFPQIQPSSGKGKIYIPSPLHKWIPCIAEKSWLLAEGMECCLGHLEVVARYLIWRQLWLSFTWCFSGSLDTPSYYTHSESMNSVSAVKTYNPVLKKQSRL